jgi:hypothetical protein
MNTLPARQAAIHGDASLHNVFITARGAMFTDFEACLGSPEWDICWVPETDLARFQPIDRHLLSVLSDLRRVCQSGAGINVNYQRSVKPQSIISAIWSINSRDQRRLWAEAAGPRCGTTGLLSRWAQCRLDADNLFTASFLWLLPLIIGWQVYVREGDQASQRQSRLSKPLLETRRNIGRQCT